MCRASTDVRFVPIVDIALDLDDLVRCSEQRLRMVRPSAFAVLRLITSSYLISTTWVRILAAVAPFSARVDAGLAV